MLPDFTIGPLIIRTYSLFLSAATVLGLGVMAWVGERQDGQNGLAWVDAGLWALGTGILTGRLGHAAIYWPYFAEHLSEVPQVWRGGLDWHAAIAGGLFALALFCWRAGLRFRRLTAALALILPSGAALIYTGCWMVSCGHGREVASLADYPALAVAELPDLYGIIAPRLASQMFGVILCVALFVLSLALTRWIRRPGMVFWLVLAGLGAGTFAIGFTRGDAAPMVGMLRIDQVLDLAVVLAGLCGAALSLRMAAANDSVTPDIV